MMSCKQMTELISQSLDRKLNAGERVSLTFHLMMCEGCTNFRDNMQFLHKACQGLANDTGPGDPRPDGTGDDFFCRDGAAPVVQAALPSLR